MTGDQEIWQVAVLGSINVDVILRVARSPLPGETCFATSSVHTPGGKGANQAVAAARAGAAVAIIGAVGDDADGQMMLALLRQEGVNCAQVSVNARAPTGTAYVLVDDEGENRIIVSGGANLTIAEPAKIHAQVYLCQLETGAESATAFLRNRPEGAIGILNAAPYCPDAGPSFKYADFIVVNETELASYIGDRTPSTSLVTNANRAKTLLASSSQKIVVTLGAKGSLVVDQAGYTHYPTPEVIARDTTGAGDCFCGYLAVGLAHKQSLPDAIATAQQASSLCVQQSAGIPSMPSIAVPFANDLALPAH